MQKKCERGLPFVEFADDWYRSPTVSQVLRTFPFDQASVCQMAWPAKTVEYMNSRQHETRELVHARSLGRVLHAWATPGAAVAPKPTKNGRRSRADGVSMGPSALNRKNGAVQSSVRSRNSTRALCFVPPRRQCAQKPVSEDDLTALGRYYGRLYSPGVAAQRSWFGGGSS